MKQVLLISNSGVLLDNKAGNPIDLFDGEICRFNDFVLKGYSDYVGTRCDWLLGNNRFFNLRKYNVKHRMFVGYSRPAKRILDRTQSKYIGDDIVIKARELTGLQSPGGGILGIIFFLGKGSNVFIHGFDCCCDKRMHYWESEQVNNVAYSKRLKWHDRDAERAWIDGCLKSGKIAEFIV